MCPTPFPRRVGRKMGRRKRIKLWLQGGEQQLKSKNVYVPVEGGKDSGCWRPAGPALVVAIVSSSSSAGSVETKPETAIVDAASNSTRPSRPPFHPPPSPHPDPLQREPLYLFARFLFLGQANGCVVQRCFYPPSSQHVPSPTVNIYPGLHRIQ